MATDDVDRQDPQITARLKAALDQVPGLFERAHVVELTGQSRRSRATQDAARPLGRLVSILASGHIENGIDHLLSWHWLLLPPATVPPAPPAEGRQPIAAHLTLIRGAMEGAVMCRWLIDPGVDPAVRIQRAVALQLEDYRQRRAYDDDSGVAPDAPPSGHGKTGAQRYKDLTDERERAKIPGVEVLNYTGLFGLYAGYASVCEARARYRLLSAAAHGMQWGDLHTKTLRRIEGGPRVPGGAVLNSSADDKMAAEFTEAAVNLARLALDELADYRGLALAE